MLAKQFRLVEQRFHEDTLPAVLLQPPGLAAFRGVIRADFDYRASVLRQFPGTFSVPARYIKHMMVVADLARGDAGAIEDALEVAFLFNIYDRLADAMGWDVPSRASGYYQVAAKRLLNQGYH